MKTLHLATKSDYKFTIKHTTNDYLGYICRNKQNKPTIY